MTNGPSLLGPIFGLFVVLMFRVSNQTLSPCLNGEKVFFLWSDILRMASSCAARASSLSLIIACSRCSMDRYFVFSNVIGMDLGDSPSISSKGECFLSACRWLLWVN